MKLNKGKWDSRTENRQKLWNETKFYSWRNKTKQNFAVYFVSWNKRNFAKQFCCFALFRVSRNKKRMRNGNPTPIPLALAPTLYIQTLSELNLSRIVIRRIYLRLYTRVGWFFTFSTKVPWDLLSKIAKIERNKLLAQWSLQRWSQFFGSLMH
jgi:hypothetical protein